MFPEEAYPDVGSIHTWRGIFILSITCGAQLIDNVFMTAVNLSLPKVQDEFDVSSGDLQWLLSAYTLTFGGFLLFSGVLADRYGRQMIFSVGMLWLSIWTLAIGFGNSFIQVAIFRALQGIGAAMTVPSAIGIISSYFVASERAVALTFFGASGAIGFAAGLLFGGFVTEALGWRYIFRIAVVATTPLGILGWFCLPNDRREGSARPSLDFVGAGLSTSGLILLSFVLSSGGEYGWNKAFIIALLVISVVMLGVFTFAEKKVRNSIMPLSLWKIKNFAPLWVTGFLVYGSYQTVTYYVVLQAQEVAKLSPGATALRFLPMGAAGLTTNMVIAKWMKQMNMRYLMTVGGVITLIAPIPASLMPEDKPDFWRYILPTSIMVVTGVSICYICTTNIMLESVPTNVKSLCGGLINTAFQIGSGVSLALASAIVNAVDIKKGHSEAKQFQTGLFCCIELSLIGLIVSLFGMRGLRSQLGGSATMH
ncbi:MFS general substrate transporter [Dothidotthia symphoricarpi CBS 119687]|uniref:MFS general substrate transporter n=1 Tax=Dothidotthia symphoricarpi CBS 119687 TaxID=1392245 RepID=A0A6A6ABQ1_9PLEO|nr:MFS general substrate transporter [Dothidotthia symphoricarpi CBS 119687]KAF2128287.1 MFS general substrate transporter [Dothidotthia symphoricarpi CBS 119687]